MIIPQLPAGQKYKVLLKKGVSNLHPSWVPANYPVLIQFVPTTDTVSATYVEFLTKAALDTVIAAQKPAYDAAKAAQVPVVDARAIISAAIDVGQAIIKAFIADAVAAGLGKGGKVEPVLTALQPVNALIDVGALKEASASVAKVDPTGLDPFITPATLASLEQQLADAATKLGSEI